VSARDAFPLEWAGTPQGSESEMTVAADRRLTIVTRTQGANADLTQGMVRPAHSTFDFIEVPVLVHAFRRMVRDLEFDVCEMAATTYLCAREHGVPITALPIFLIRGLHHGAMVVAADSTLDGPRALVDLRVGVNRGYTVTTGVWARGILQDEYGLELDRVTWAPSGDEHVDAYRPPPNVEPLAPGQDLAELVVTGELPAAIGITADRPELRSLVPDADTAALRALTERGLYPINHLVVVRDDILASRPDVAEDVFEAFAEAKRRYVDRLRDGVDAPSPADELNLRVMAATGSDPLPYGIEPNREMIDLLLDHAVRQGILRQRPSVASLFHPATLEVTA